EAADPDAVLVRLRRSASETHHAAGDYRALAVHAPDKIRVDHVAEPDAETLLVLPGRTPLIAERQRIACGLAERRRKIERESLQVRFDDDLRHALLNVVNRAPVRRSAETLQPERHAARTAHVVGIEAPLRRDADRAVLLGTGGNGDRSSDE